MRKLEHGQVGGQQSPRPALEKAELLHIGWFLGPHRCPLSPNKLREPGEIGLDRLPQGRLVKGRSRMVHGHDESIPNSLRFAVYGRDARIWEKTRHRKAAQGYDDFRIE